MSHEDDLKELRALIAEMRAQLASGTERFVTINERCQTHNAVLFDPETGAIAKIAVIRERLAIMSDTIDIMNSRLRKMENAYWRGVGALAVIQTIAVVLMKLL
jgi:hypothetical protein